MYQKLYMGLLLLLVAFCDISRASDYQDIVCTQMKFKPSPLNEEDLEIMHDTQRAEGAALREAKIYYCPKDLNQIEQLRLFIELGNDIDKLSSQDRILCMSDPDLYQLLIQKGLFVRS